MNKPTTPILLSAEALRHALSGLGRLWPRKITLPVLGTVRVIRHRGAVTLAATDLDIHLTYTHRAEPEPITELAKALAEMAYAREPAEGICVPFGALKAAAKAKGDILIAADKITYSTTAGETVLPFDALPADEFPPGHDSRVQAPMFARVATFDAAARAALIEAADFTSRDETRYVLNGVYLEPHPPGAKKPEPSLVATDGRRLYTRPAPFLAGLPQGIILPSAALTVLGTPALLAHDWHMGFTQSKDTVRPPSKAAMADYEKAVALWEKIAPKLRKDIPKPKKPASETIPGMASVLFRAGPWCLTGKTVEGNFPNWRQVVPNFTDPITVTFTEEQAAQFRAVLAQWPKGKDSNDGISLAFPGTGLRITDKNGTVHLLPGVRSTLPIGISVNRGFLADAVALGAPVLHLHSDREAMDFRIGAARVIIMPLRTGSVPVEDTARESAEKEWLGCIVTLPQKISAGTPGGMTGNVIAIVREGAKLLATVQDGTTPPVEGVPLTAMKFHDRPAAKAA